MNVKEIKEIVEDKKLRREEEVTKLITENIKQVIEKLESNKIKQYEAIFQIETIMREVREASQDVNEYWRVLDTLEYID